MAHLKLTNKDMVETSHGKRAKDAEIDADGKVTFAGEPITVTLKTEQPVNRVTVQRAADGSLHITLEK